MKLNLGCGRNPISGYINVDIVEYPGVDVVYDITKLEKLASGFVWEGKVDEILAKDVIEHFHIKDVQPMLNTWAKFLKKGGIIHLEFPDAVKHCKMLVEGKWDINRFNYQFYSEREPGQVPGEDWNLHKSAYNDELIISILMKAGVIVKSIEHFDTPSTFNMRVIGVKV